LLVGYLGDVYVSWKMTQVLLWARKPKEICQDSRQSLKGVELEPLGAYVVNSEGGAQVRNVSVQGNTQGT